MKSLKFLCDCHTLCTANVSYDRTDVIVALKEFAFKNSPYPITLSIENHCCLEQQKRLAVIFESVLGDMVLKPGEFLTGDIPGFLPSPERAKRKFIIKGKRIQAADAEQKFEDDDENDEDPEHYAALMKAKASGEEIDLSGEVSQGLATEYSTMSLEPGDEDDEEKVSARETLRQSSIASLEGDVSKRSLGAKTASTVSVQRSNSSASVASASGKDEKKKKKKKHHENTHPRLSALTYLGTCKHKSFDNSPTIACDMMSSYSEGNTVKFLKKPAMVEGWLAHNVHHVRCVLGGGGSHVDSLSSLELC